jgi:hypothetical protein
VHEFSEETSVRIESREVDVEILLSRLGLLSLNLFGALIQPPPQSVGSTGWSNYADRYSPRGCGSVAISRTELGDPEPWIDVPV